jgi:hypothetical protein
VRIALPHLLLLAGALVANDVWGQQTAAPGPRLVVVDVTSDDPSFDAAKLRTDVAAELGAEAVPPDDPRATTAVGTIRVSINHSAHVLLVSFRGGAEPVERWVELPGDDLATEKAAVRLSVSLAHGEATKSTPAPGPASAPAPAAPLATSPGAPGTLVSEDLSHLAISVAFTAGNIGGRRTGQIVLASLGWGTLALGAGVAIYGLTSKAQWAGAATFYTLQAADLLFAADAFLRAGAFGEVTAAYSIGRARRLPAATIRTNVEQAWLRAAEGEHSSRHTWGIVDVCLGSLVVGLSTVGLGLGLTQTQQSSDLWPFAGWIVVGAADVGVGLYYLLADGPVESGLRRYQQAAGGIVRRPAGETSLSPIVAPTPGGAFVGVGGRF